MMQSEVPTVRDMTVMQLTSRSQHSERESCLCAQLTSRKPALRVRERKLSVCTTHIKEASAQSQREKAVCVHNSHQGSQRSESERESCLCAQLTSRKPALRAGKLSLCCSKSSMLSPCSTTSTTDDSLRGRTRRHHLGTK